MDIYKKIIKKANKLVAKLQDDITNGEKQICENYGQKEIQKFQDKQISQLKNGILTYQEECNIKSILYEVSSIS